MEKKTNEVLKVEVFLNQQLEAICVQVVKRTNKTLARNSWKATGGSPTSAAGEPAEKVSTEGHSSNILAGVELVSQI